MGNGIEALKDLGALAEFAYEQGFHEMGYDPIAEVRAAYDHEKARAVQAELERDRLETAARAYIEGHELALMRAEAAKEALAAARRDLPVGLEWQAILDALIFTERNSGLVSDAHIHAKRKVAALSAPAAAAGEEGNT